MKERNGLFQTLLFKRFWQKLRMQNSDLAYTVMDKFINKINLKSALFTAIFSKYFRPDS